MLSSGLRQTLATTIDALRIAHDPWWFISSAAVALHGIRSVTPADVDVLTSVADAQRLMVDLAIVAEGDTTSVMFRSAVFGRWTAPPLVVEIMADFQVATPEGWIAIRPQTRLPVMVGARRAYIPSRGELAAMLMTFGRCKDLARARLLLT